MNHSSTKHYNHNRQRTNSAYSQSCSPSRSMGLVTPPPPYAPRAESSDRLQTKLTTEERQTNQSRPRSSSRSRTSTPPEVPSGSQQTRTYARAASSVKR